MVCRYPDSVICKHEDPALYPGHACLFHFFDKINKFLAHTVPSDCLFIQGGFMFCSWMLLNLRSTTKMSI